MRCNDGVWSANLPQCKGNGESEIYEGFEVNLWIGRRSFPCGGVEVVVLSSCLFHFIKDAAP